MTLPEPFGIGGHRVSASAIALGTIAVVWLLMKLADGDSPQPIPSNVAANLVATKPGTEATSTAAQTSSTTEPEASLVGRPALERTVDLLEIGKGWLNSTSGYTATLCRQERVGDELLEPEQIDLKIRHEPFSVYMKWTTGDIGRELLFVDGQNDGQMLVRLGGWKSRLIPPLWIDPHGDRAARQSRYPVSQVGLLTLVTTLADDRRRDLTLDSGVRCRLEPGHLWNDRDCWRVDLEYDDPQVCRNYRRSVQYIDRQWQVPIHIRNYAWPTKDDAALAVGCTPDDLDAITLIEHYDFRDIEPQERFAEIDFDRSNEAYKFRR